jgi:hypothetical protein
MVAAATIFFLSCLGMGLGARLGGWFFKGFGTYNLMYLLSFAASGIGALLAAMLRPPRIPWRSQWSQCSLAVEGT